MAPVAPPQHLDQTVLSREDLRLLRLTRDWTLRDLGARVGASASHLCLVEQGRRPISPALAMRLLRALMLGEDAQ